MDIALLAMEEKAELQNPKIEDVVATNRRRLLDFIRFRVPDEEDAEDILQDVFYELVQSYRFMRPVQQLASWLFTVARNKITDRYRKQRPARLVSEKPGGEEEDTLFLADIIKNNDDSAETLLMREAIMDEIAEGLEQLPAAQREVFEMHELEGMKFEEIAAITGVSVKTLISRKRYALNYLRDRLQYLYDDLLNN
jgi:RNA polymerase sigma factor (sigma-70 family)